MEHPTSADALVSRNLATPMRDGTVLRADLYLPGSGGPWPALVQRTPYGKSALLPPIGTLDPIRACGEGFAVLIQDVRGRYRSEGEFYPYRHEEADGYDTIEWTAGQPWCNGRVGIYGRSYAGSTAWLAAAGNPPHLGALVPMVAGSDCCEGWTYRRGGLEYAFILGWILGELGVEYPATGAVPFEEYAALSDRLPDYLSGSAPPPWEEISRFAPYVSEWLDRPYDESYWGPWAITPRLHPGTAPSLSISGWFDMFAPAVVELFTHLQRLDGGAERHALVMGPWAHVNPFSQVVGEVDFGLRASPAFFDVHGAMLNWFKRWLVGPEQARPMPRVQAFTMGANRWLAGESWPPVPTTEETLYLNGGGGANGLEGDGGLAPHPSTEGHVDTVLYDAGRLVPTLGGRCAPRVWGNRPGVFDQRPLERRPDVLVYTGEPLDQPLAIAGTVSATLYASASEGEMDLVVKLVDVAPDGTARNLADGFVRCQHVAPGASGRGDLVAYSVDLGPTANVFGPGHRVRVDVATSSFPRFAPNPLARDGAIHTLGHGRAQASRITLPVREG